MKMSLSKSTLTTGQTFIPNRRFYKRLNDVAEYLKEMAGNKLHL